MSEKPHCTSDAQRCTILISRSEFLLTIKEINQILRKLVPQIMESKSLPKGSYNTPELHSQTAMKMQEIDLSCTKEVRGCI